ncbi:hypothetical protein [Thermomonospora catenispora]|uniref:hypothetical protein n=1 Tax=Thermomonospora catenispora TaxID=2493090 RepID=UPI00111F7818|nr:hypothetical protein [Thermomonospora catenispora]TNY37554.1 hypothetical protein EIO00_07020 [Thermomonospora catenispora]
MARRAAAQSRSIEEFLDHLHRTGMLVRLRYSTLHPGQITGYALALPDHVGPDGQPLWYSGSRLAEDLTMPALRRRWSSDPAPLNWPGLTAEERQAIYQDAARAAAYATAHLRRHLAINPYAAGDICWAAADLLHTAARATGNPHLRKAADAYDRAARTPYTPAPPPSPAGVALRTAARVLALTTPGKDRTAHTALLLITSLITLVDTVVRLRQAQHHIAQAMAARTAYHHLNHLGEAPQGSVPWFVISRRTPTPVQLATTDFPTSWTQFTPTNSISHQNQELPPRPNKRHHQTVSRYPQTHSQKSTTSKQGPHSAKR